MNRASTFNWGFVALLCLMLAACGGDGGTEGTGGATDPINPVETEPVDLPTSLSGTAAVGKPLANADVTVKDRTGKKLKGKTDANGKYKIDVTDLTAPYLVKVVKLDDDESRSFFAAAATHGVTNLHPLSDVAARNWFGVRNRHIDQEFDDDKEIANPPTANELTELSGAIRTLLRIAYSQFEVGADFDFDHSAFDANGSAFDGLLDNLRITFAKNKITIQLRDPKTGVPGYIVIAFDLSESLATPDTVAPTLPTGLQAFPASTTGMVVVWNSSRDNVGVAGYNVYRDGVKVTTSPYPVFSDTGLTESTRYCYTIEAFDGADNKTVATSSACATTLGEPDIASPAAPQSLSAKPIGTRSLVLAWVPSLDNDVLGYDIYRGPAGAVKQKVATTVASGFTDSGLTNGTEYCYQTRAFDAALNRSIFTDETCVTTLTNDPPTDTTAPTSSADPAIGGPFTVAQNVTLTCVDTGGSDCAAIYYSVDGSEPTTFSYMYSQPIGISKSTTLRFFAIDQAGNVEATQHTVTYIINIPDVTAPTNATALNFINSGAATTGSLTLTLGLAATDNVAVTAYYVVATVNGEPTTAVLPLPNSPGWTAVAAIPSYAANVSYTMTNTVASGDTLYIHVWFKDAAGNVSGEMVDSILYSVPVVANTPPVANAGVGQTVKTGNQVTLDGGASSDADGDRLSFNWTIKSQPALSTATLADANTAYPRIVPDQDGVYEMSLVVNDGKENSITPSVVNIAADATKTNRAPIANAGIDQSFTLAGQVELKGGASTDPDNDPISHHWSFVKTPTGSQAKIADPSAELALFNTDLGGNYIAALVVNDGQVNSAADFVTKGLVVTGTEAEPNNTSAEAQMLDRIGWGNPVKAVYEGARTDDWYRFNAVKGMTYVVELFNVSATLQNGNNYGNICDSVNNYSGLYLAIQDSDGTPIAKQCGPNGIANGQSQTQFTAAASGTYFIKVAHNLQTTALSGEYQLRILPNHMDAAAAWDATQEPNNAAANAYLLQVGLTNGLASSIEVRSSLYYTQNADVDWYRFEATAGVTYVIELFNVLATLQNGNNYGNVCNSVNNYSGLYLAVQDSDGASVAKQCGPNGIANGQSQTQFTAAASGTYYIKVAHNLQTTALTGDYQIRILPKHDAAAAAWDANQEPNNAAANAYLMQVGSSNALTSSIEARSTLYYTQNADVDWYRFEATAGVTYVIELFDVLATLQNGNNYGNICDSVNLYSGLYIAIEDNVGTPVKKQCQPNGVANVESQTQFTAAASGTYYIKVAHNLAVTGLSGEYRIRILPKHDNAAAAWDATHEPNNAAANAYLLQAGSTNSLTSSIEARSTLYYTLNADVDWYRFEATEGVTYVIELFDVLATLHNGNNYGPACSGGTIYPGLYLMLFDANVGELAKQCTANGTAPLQVLLTYAASTSGVHYIKTGHNLATTVLNGTYSIRITPQ